jgi:hypothetical protein
VTLEIAPVLGPIGSLTDQACSYAELGFEVFPANPRDKTPLTSQLSATTDLDTIEAWWSEWPEALIGHRISPLHLLLDVDPRHNGMSTWRALKAEMPVFTTRTHRSGRGDGGGHIWFQRPGEHVSVAKLDAWAQERGHGHAITDDDGNELRWSAGIDLLRHEHRYTILPPSLHPETRQPYQWTPGKGFTLEPAPMPQLLCDLLVRAEGDLLAASGGRLAARDLDVVHSIADWFCATFTWRRLLQHHDWILISGNGDSDGSRWRHPEASAPHSATINHGCLFVYSPNTPFEPTAPGDVHGYTLFRAYAALEHQGQLDEAGRAARKLKDSTSSLELVAPTPAGNGTATSPNGNRPGRRVDLTWAATIDPKRVKWCWNERIALGTIALLAGPEGLGKSTVGYWLAARVSRGELPGEHFGTPKVVLVCATEDSWAHTIVPRLMAAGADLSRVARIEVHTEEELTIPLSLPVDLVELDHVATEVGAALLLLDPLMSRLDAGLDTHRDGEVRRALEPLASIADGTGMSILGLIHHNKSGSSDPLQLVMASKAFTAVARSVQTVIKDPDDETGLRRMFGTVKNNLGRGDLPTLPFVIESWSYDTDDGPGSTGKIVWGEEVAETIADALARSFQDPEQRTALDEAAAWLNEYMILHGPKVFSGDAKSAGRAAGHSQRTVERAPRKLGLDIVKEGFPARVYWVRSPGPSNGHPVTVIGGAEEDRSFDPEESEPWCRFGAGTALCLNGDDCPNPNHRRSS